MPQKKQRVVKKGTRSKGTRRVNEPRRDPMFEELTFGVNEDLSGDLSIPSEAEDDYVSPGPLSFSVHPLSIYRTDSPETAYAKSVEITRRKDLRKKKREVDAENKRVTDSMPQPSSAPKGAATSAPSQDFSFEIDPGDDPIKGAIVSAIEQMTGGKVRRKKKD